MPATDVYVLILHSTIGSDPQELLNVFHYKRSLGTNTSEELINQFDDVVMPFLGNLISSYINFNTLEAYSMLDPTDFFARAPATYISGGVSGDVLPVWNNFSFIYHRPSRAVRNGWKRFPGVPESSQNAGSISGGAITEANNLANKLQDILVSTDLTTTYTPGIWSDVLDDFFAVSSVSFQKLGTQNTRKR